jgi:TolB-like protein
MADRAEPHDLQGSAANAAAKTEQARVFVSYASSDAAVAGALVESLERHGIACWIAPRDVKAGALYADAIVRAISSARTLVLVLSENAIGSSHVGKEIERASSKKRPIIALQIDNAPLTPALEYFLSESQWVEAQAENKEAAYARLIDAIREPEGAAPGMYPPVTPSAGTAPPAAQPKERRNRILLAALLIVVAVAVAALLAGKLLLGKRIPTEQAKIAATSIIGDKSIAVLPFTDMSEKKDQEYFADGIAEEILDALAKIPGLHVIGRTSSFQFKGKNEDLRKIGMELAVAHLVEGSVRRSGNQVRVTVQLNRSSDGAHEWSESYEREVGDVLRMQQDIAVSIARALQVTVEAASISASRAINPDAYDFFLRGLHAFDRNDKPGLEEAISDFQNASQLEPSLARADDALALAQLEMAEDVYEQQEAGFVQARESAQRLLKRNPRSPHGHVLMSRIYADYDWDWAAAKREAEEAIAISPRFSGGLYAMGFVAGYLGQWNEGERYYRAALSLDPLNPDFHYDFGVLLLGAGRYSESVAELRRAYEISPSYAWSHAMTGIALLATEQRDAALHEAQQESMDGAKLFALAVIYYSMGQKANSDAALAQLTRDAADRMAAQIAYVHAHRGETDQAFEWLERAYRQKDTGLPYIKEYPFLLKNIEGDPRYKAFLKKMNLPE